MSTFLQYLRDRRGAMLLQIAFFAVFAISFALYRLPLAAVLYPAALCLLIGGVYTCFSLRRAHEKQEALRALCGCDAETLRDRRFPAATSAERAYRAIADQLCAEALHARAEADRARREATDYYTAWVHQVKTPIASMRLRLKAADDPMSRALASDLLHIEQYVDMALTYARMGADASDYVFRTVSVDEVIREAVRRLRGDFILKGLALQYDATGLTAVTDEKWLSFVIGQVLSNAVKYTRRGRIHIYSDGPLSLCVADTGIGILPEDLPRVFEKGFTGFNGRSEKSATGLGLYLCKQICDRLGLTIDIRSEPDVGTTVIIGFPSRR